MAEPTDVEISRAVNALSTTLRDQRPDALDAGRCQAICDGALGGESKLEVRLQSGGSAQVVARDGGTLLATIGRDASNWVVSRVRSAHGSQWARPSA